MPNRTKMDKPTAWALVQLVEQPNGNITMYLSRSGPSRDSVANRNVKQGVHLQFAKGSGQSGKAAHSKLKALIDREQ